MALRGTDTRLALVETAERLFAEQGIASVSLRDVCAAAGQRNHSAAQYHFGDRAGLVAAVFEHRMRHVNALRHAMLDAIPAAAPVPGPDPALAPAAGPAAAPLTEVVRALVEPLATVVASTDGWYGRFLARTQWDSFARDVVSGLPVLSSFRRASELVVAHLRPLPADIIALRLDQVATLLVGTIAGWEWRRHRDEPSVGLEVLQADLVSTMSAVLTAPSVLTAPAAILAAPASVADLPIPSNAPLEGRS